MEMNNFGVSFRGKRIVHPGAYDYIDGSALTIVSDGGVNTPIVIGSADAGKPGELVWLSGTLEAREYLRGGELLTAVEVMFAPIPEGGGGSSIIGVIVSNENTRATTIVGGVSFASLEYGKGGNKIQVKIEDGTIAQSKKFTSYRWDLEKMEVFDNVGAVISIQYIGDETYSDLVVEDIEGVRTLTTKIGADVGSAVDDVVIDLTNEQYSTIDRVVRYFNSISGYKASVVESDNKNLASSELDIVDIVTITSPKHLMAMKGDLKYRVNNYSDLVEITDMGTVTNSPDFKYLDGGNQGTIPISWSPYFSTCSQSFSDILVLLTDDASIHAEGLAYVEEMEQRGQRQVVFTGGGIGERPEDAMKRARALNHSRMVSVYPGMYHRSVGGGKTKLPAYMTAAMIAGRVSGVDPSEPVTFDYFNVIGLLENLIAGDPTIDNLLLAGVCTLERVKNGGIRLVQGITTYTSLNNSLYREISVRRGADTLASKVRRRLEETFVGKKGLSTTETSVKTVVMDVLDEEVRQGGIMAYDPKSIVTRFTNSVVVVDYKVAPIEPINFVLITSHFVPNTQL